MPRHLLRAYDLNRCARCAGCGPSSSLVASSRQLVIGTWIDNHDRSLRYLVKAIVQSF